MSDEDVWGKGEYYRVAERLMPIAEAVVAAAEVDSLQLVLDVGAGTGNVSVAAAERHATVTAVDPSPGMVELGEQRTIGANVEWHEAGVEDLPFADAHFDATLSVMAAVFAPDAQRAADEMLRVTKPGRPVILTAWVDEGLQYEVVGLLADAGGGPRLQNPWGQAAFARERLAAASSVTVERRELPWDWDSPDAVAEYFETAVPPAVVLRERLGDGWAPVRERIVETARRHGGGDGPITGTTPYLLISARR